MAGVPAPAIRDLMGHGNLSVTSRYLHLAPSNLASAVRVLDGKPAVFAPDTTHQTTQEGKTQAAGA